MGLGLGSWSRTWVVLGLPLLAVASGCAGTGGPFASRTTVGTLKASVAQLEHERDEARKKLAQLEGENRKVRDQLAEERAANGELTARLDDARDLLSSEGLDVESRELSERASWDDERYRKPGDGTALPVKGSRKPPFAQIGGVRAIAHPDREAGEDDLPEAPGADFAPTRQSGSSDKEGGAAAPMRWLPVADATKDQKSSR